jgi:leucyl-tRNA synthetase
MILGEDGEKMSKSRGNVVNPDDIVREHGADTLRLYEMFMGPLDQAKPWNMHGVEGAARFLQRVWRLAQSPRAEAQDPSLERLRHKTIKKVGDDIRGLRLNTAISTMMIFVNAALDAGATRADLEALLIILSPFAPHIAEELWHGLGHEDLVCQQTWPPFDPALTVDDVVEVVVQINGKLRSRLALARDTSETDAVAAAKADPAAAKWLEGKTVAKIIFVQNRLVNMVVK